MSRYKIQSYKVYTATPDYLVLQLTLVEITGNSGEAVPLSEILAMNSKGFMDCNVKAVRGFGVFTLEEVKVSTETMEILDTHTIIEGNILEYIFSSKETTSE